MTTFTPELHNTLRKGTLDEIKLISKTHDLTKPDPTTSQNAFFYAALRTEPEFEDSCEEICQFLAELGVDPKQVDANGQTALFYACRDGNIIVTKFLISKGVSHDHVDSCNNQTAIFFAAREGRIDIVKFLHELGTNIDLVDKNGQTPLFYAASNGKEDAVLLLLELGADPNVKDALRHTASWFARERGFGNVEALLKSRMTSSRMASHGSETSGVTPATRGSAGGKTRRSETKPPRVSKTRAVSDGNGGTQHTPSSVPANATRMKCRIVCRPVGTTEWMVPDEDALDDFEGLCPELAHWSRTMPPSATLSEWRKKWASLAKQLLDSICKLEPAAYFLKPVDVQKLRCFDYFDVVKRPMDFGTVRQKLKDARYRNPKEFLADVSLIFENCRRYNAATTPVAHAGVKTEADWEALVKSSPIEQLQTEFDEFTRRNTILQKARLGVIDS